MSYRHDVFISYRREAIWTRWTREHVRPLMAGYLQQELGRAPDIFIDERIDPGVDWPRTLGDSLAHSRIMVAFFSRDYFGSEWCLHELDLMHERMKQHPGSTLIIPINAHDGDLVPDEIGRYQAVDFKRFRNAYLCKDTPRYQDFADAMDQLAPKIASAIGSAPTHEMAWKNYCQSRFELVYAGTKANSQVALTTMTRKSLPVPTAVPRPRP